MKKKADNFVFSQSAGGTLWFTNLKDERMGRQLPAGTWRLLTDNQAFTVNTVEEVILFVEEGEIPAYAKPKVTKKPVVKPLLPLRRAPEGRQPSNRQSAAGQDGAISPPSLQQEDSAKHRYGC
jgi:hypothetical protein